MNVTFSGAGARGGVLQLSQLCKGGYWHDKNHFSTSEGSASYDLLLYWFKIQSLQCSPSVLCGSKVSSPHTKTSPLPLLFGGANLDSEKHTLPLQMASSLSITNLHVSLSPHPKKHYGFKDKQMEGQGIWKVSTSLIALHLPHFSISHLLPLSIP